MIDVSTSPEDRICQGDVFLNIEYLERATECDGILEMSKILFPYAVVLTQDCDLAQDYAFREEERPTRDKWLISVLVAPAYNAEHVFAGDHLSEIEIASVPISRDRSPGRLLKNNETPRYHYLEFPPEIRLVPLVIDFKHYFSVPVPYLTELKKTNFVCKVSGLYREDISHRFASFLSRIGLPELAWSPASP